MGLGFFFGSFSKDLGDAESPELDTIVNATGSAAESTTEEKPFADKQQERKIKEQDDDSPRVLTAEESHTIELFENAARSVAFINTSNVRQDYFTRDLAEIPRGSGSGFIWDLKGHVVTNWHVLEGADRASVTLADGTTWDASLVGIAQDKDLAVLKIETPVEQLYPIPRGRSYDLLVGQAVYAIGNPFGLDQTLTTGIISALGREISSVSGVPIRDAIQTDAAINPGNSGGPLLDSSGNLIGVNTAIYSTSGSYAGIGFSIPVDIVKWVVPDLIQFGRIKRPTLGVEIAPNNYTQRIGKDGVLIIGVVSQGPADQAGLLPTYRNNNGQIVLGDIIVGIDSEKIENVNDLTLALEKFLPGDQVTVSILRNEKILQSDLVLGEAK